MLRATMLPNGAMTRKSLDCSSLLASQPKPLVSPQMYLVYLVNSLVLRISISGLAFPRFARHGLRFVAASTSKI
jgi:hypothetical protein